MVIITIVLTFKKEILYLKEHKILKAIFFGKKLNIYF